MLVGKKATTDDSSDVMSIVSIGDDDDDASFENGESDVVAVENGESDDVSNLNGEGDGAADGNDADDEAGGDDGDKDGDFHPPPDATLEEALTTYWDVIAESNRIFAAASLDDIEASSRAQYSVRWILVHLVEEYARHCGHADLLRQAIDGATGD